MCNDEVRKHSVSRIYKAGTWDSLTFIICNKCRIEKKKENYAHHRYTCRECVNECKKIAKQQPKEIATEKHPKNQKQRMYKNCSWASLATIKCGKCDIEKPREDFKENRYICRKCCNEHMKELNKKKSDGRYVNLQKEYYMKYENSEHGAARRREYRNKLKEARQLAHKMRKTNPLNRLRIHLRRKIGHVLGQRHMKVSDALQYLGISPHIFKTWVEYNFEGDMSWDNMGILWKMEVWREDGAGAGMPGTVGVGVHGVVSGDMDGSVIPEKTRYEILNWRLWCPVVIGASPKDCRNKSVEFFSTIT